MIAAHVDLRPAFCRVRGGLRVNRRREAKGRTGGLGTGELNGVLDSCLWFSY